MFRRSNFVEPEVSSANLLPMIDVLFVVMAFLILAANFVDQPTAMLVDLPASRTASEFSSNNNSSDVRLSKDGLVHVSGESFQIDSFTQGTHSGLAQTVRLFADKEVKFDLFVRLYDHLASRLNRQVFLMIEKRE